MRLVIVAALLLALPLRAADVEAGAQHVIAIAAGDTGTLDVLTSRGFAAHLDVFWSERVSTRVAATFVNPAAILFPENPPPNDVDLGTLGLDVYAATARVHFARRGRFSAFAGGGAAYVVVGNLDDQFDDEIEVELDPETTFVAEGGVRYRVHPRIVLEVGASWMPLELEAPAPLPPAIAVDPLLVSVGASWRF